MTLSIYLRNISYEYKQEIMAIYTLDTYITSNEHTLRKSPPWYSAISPTSKYFSPAVKSIASDLALE